MSRKLFAQIVLLIFIAGAVYVGIIQALHWQSQRIYVARVRAIHAESENQIQSMSARLGPDPTISDHPDAGENMIDGQIVHKRDGKWVNDVGRIMGRGE